MPLADIETIVIVMQENRSFDHTLGYLALPTTPNPIPLEGVSDNPSWLAFHANVSGSIYAEPYRLDPVVQDFDDPVHTEASVAMQINTPPASGAPQLMGGFVANYLTLNPQPKNPKVVMGYYDAEGVPIYDFFARNYAVCDHWFAALPTGTQPNRLMAMSGESLISDDAPVFLPDQQLAYDWLSSHGVSWCAYQSGDFFPFFALMPRWLPEIVTSLTLPDIDGRGRFRRYTAFRDQWLGATPMPSVIFIEPEYTDGPHADANDDHPPTGIAKGQLFLADIYTTLTANPERWKNTMLVVTYDEHGGIFDHVPPLPIPAEAGGVPFKTTGVRVPALVISPHVVPGSVFSGHLDHTSLLQLLADRFNPGQTYSAAVATRQQRLDRLSRMLADPPPQAVAPAIPAATLAAIQAIAAGMPASSVPASDTTRAFNGAVLKTARDHPQLLAADAWTSLRNYLTTLV